MLQNLQEVVMMKEILLQNIYTQLGYYDTQEMINILAFNH